MLLKDKKNYCACVRQLIVQAELLMPLEQADRSVPLTCTACVFYTNELGLSLWRARVSPIAFQQANVLYHMRWKWMLEESWGMGTCWKDDCLEGWQLRQAGRLVQPLYHTYWPSFLIGMEKTRAKRNCL